MFNHNLSVSLLCLLIARDNRSRLVPRLPPKERRTYSEPGTPHFQTAQQTKKYNPDSNHAHASPPTTHHDEHEHSPKTLTYQHSHQHHKHQNAQQQTKNRQSFRQTPNNASNHQRHVSHRNAHENEQPENTAYNQHRHPPQMTTNAHAHQNGRHRDKLALTPHCHHDHDTNHPSKPQHDQTIPHRLNPYQ